MVFGYNREANNAIWSRIVNTKEMFEMKFPDAFSITPKDEEQAKKSALKFASAWNNRDKEMKEKISKIYGYEIPDEKLICYINTSRYSSVGPEAKYISLSMLRPIECVPSTIIHEFSHLAFYLQWSKFCQEIGYTKSGIEELKEVLTVINDFEFKNIRDNGYKVHKSIREIVKDMWLAGKNLKEITGDIEIIKSISFLNTIKK